MSNGHTGHTEAVRVTYDPDKVSYAQLVEYFWRTIDPTEKDRQFCDIGDQYRSGIYWGNEAERKVVEASRDALLKTGRFKNIYTELAPAIDVLSGGGLPPRLLQEKPGALQLLPPQLRARCAA